MHIYCIYRQDLTQKRKDTHTETLVLTQNMPENMVSFYIGVCEEMAEQKNFETMNTDRMERLQDSLPWIVLAAALFVIFRFVIGVAVVDGDSMDPRLTRGSLVLYYRMVQEYEPGDVISFRVSSGSSCVRRIEAVGGDEVDLREGSVYINGTKYEDLKAQGATFRKGSALVYPYKVRKDNVFVLGDNREEAVDSRIFGEVNLQQIRGKVLVRLCPGYF